MNFIQKARDYDRLYEHYLNLLDDYYKSGYEKISLIAANDSLLRRIGHLEKEIVELKKNTTEPVPCRMCGRLSKFGESPIGDKMHYRYCVDSEHSVTVRGRSFAEAIALWNKHNS